MLQLLTGGILDCLVVPLRGGGAAEAARPPLVAGAERTEPAVVRVTWRAGAIRATELVLRRVPSAEWIAARRLDGRAWTGAERIVVEQGLPSHPGTIAIELGLAERRVAFETTSPARLAAAVIDGAAATLGGWTREAAPDGARWRGPGGAILTLGAGLANEAKLSSPRLAGAWLTEAPPSVTTGAAPEAPRESVLRRLTSPLSRHRPTGSSEAPSGPPLRLRTWATFADGRPRPAFAGRLKVTGRAGSLPDLGGEILLSPQVGLRAWSPTPGSAAPFLTTAFFAPLEAVVRRWPATSFELSRAGMAVTSHDLFDETAGFAAWVTAAMEAARLAP